MHHTPEGKSAIYVSYLYIDMGTVDYWPQKNKKNLQRVLSLCSYFFHKTNDEH